MTRPPVTRGGTHVDDDLPRAVRALIDDPAFHADADAAFRALVTLAEAWQAAIGASGPGRATPERC